MTSIGIPADTWTSPRLSPDGSKLLLLRLEPNESADIYIWDFATENLSQLTFHGYVYSPIWSHDGSQVFYSRWDPQRSPTEGMWQIESNGFGQPEQILETARNVQPMLATEDGSELWYIYGQGSVNNSVDVIHLDENNRIETLIPPTDQYEISTSPDGNWVSVARRDGAGSVGVFVSQSSDILEGARMVAPQGRQPRWANNNSDIYYINDYTRNLRSATIINSSPFQTEDNGIVIENIYYEVVNSPSYDVSEEDSRLLVLVYEDENFSPEQQLEMVLVDNWFEELARLAPPSSD